MAQVGATFGAEAAFVEPEILKIDRATVDRFVAAEPRLKVYGLYLDDILRRAAAHRQRSRRADDRAIARSMAAAPSEHLRHPVGRRLPVSDRDAQRRQERAARPARASASYRGVPNREDRKKVMSTFFNALGELPRHVRRDDERRGADARVLREGAQVRDGARGARSTAPNIPASVYTRLVDGVNKNLPTFHRYLTAAQEDDGRRPSCTTTTSTRRSSSSVDLELHRRGGARSTCWPRSRRSAPTTSAARSGAFNERWIDLYPTPGKRAGAYSNGGAYDVHPYMLLNYNGKYTDMSTLAHELGHTMQSYFSNKTQPYPLANYPIFVAEVASTFNEALLIDHMLKSITDDTTKLSLLGNYLENIKGTVFRQTQFAEFELRDARDGREGRAAHRRRAVEALRSRSRRSTTATTRASASSTTTSPHEWAFIPHFYRNFYVFQYATSFTASAALVGKGAGRRPGGREAVPARSSSAGGSKYPIDLLKDAGVDMTTDEPLDADDAEDEPRDGRDGAVAEVTTADGRLQIETADCRLQIELPIATAIADCGLSPRLRLQTAD